MATLTLHAVPSSHPVLTVEAALRLKGLEFERVDLPIGNHGDAVAAIYGAGARTVPGLLIDDEPVHSSVGILRRLEELVPEPALYPADVAEQVRETEEWGSEVVQSMGRHFVFGALHFRPESMGSFAGGGPLDPAGTDFAITYIRRAWRHVGITAAGLAQQLAELPAVLDRTDALAEAGVVGGEQATAADLQLGSSYRLMLNIGDLVPLLEGRAAGRIARRWFPDYAGDIPAGAFPAGWVPDAAATPAR